MTNNLRELLNKNKNRTAATDHGNRMHARLAAVCFGDEITGDTDLIAHISTNPTLRYLFGPASRVEVPVAGHINDTFTSCRIDRLLIDHATKQIHILDYKTDTDPSIFRDKYIAQLGTYAKLLHAIHQDHTIHKHILWTHTWTLEEIA